jgi:hypothetical protein
VWNTRTRFFNCTTDEHACPATLAMPVKDEKGALTISPVTVSDPYVPKYNSTSKNFDCTPNAAELVKACRQAANPTNAEYPNYAFVSVDDLNKLNGNIVCNLASKESAAAIENCSACGTAELKRDPDGSERWECTYASTWNTPPVASSLWGKMSADSDYYDTLKGQAVGTSHATNVKGVKGCFSGCESFEAQIKAGVRNTPEWGLVWRPESHMWECFTCNTTEYINSACSDGSCDHTKNGVCALKDCDESFQKRMTADGKDAVSGDPEAKCYTKWCRNIPVDVDAKVGRPNDASCINVPTHTYMTYNPEQECVYCSRVGPETVD